VHNCINFLGSWTLAALIFVLVIKGIGWNEDLAISARAFAMAWFFKGWKNGHFVAPRLGIKAIFWLLFTTTFIIHCFGAAWQDGLFSTSHRQIFQICLTDKK